MNGPPPPYVTVGQLRQWLPDPSGQPGPGAGPQNPQPDAQHRERTWRLFHRHPTAHPANWLVFLKIQWGGGDGEWWKKIGSAGGGNDDDATALIS